MTHDFRALWCLDPSVAYLNHGSYGACPLAVLDLQRSLRLELEREPVDFLSRRLPERLQSSRAALASFLGADPADLVFVPPGSLPITTSGKIRRSTCAELYRRNDFERMDITS